MHISIGECNTIPSAYTLYRHFEQHCTPSMVYACNTYLECYPAFSQMTIKVLDWLTLSQITNLDCSKLKEFVDHNFKFNEKWQYVIHTGRKH